MEQIQNCRSKVLMNSDVDQLQGWQALLEFPERSNQKTAVLGGYIGHNYREGAARVTFFLDKEKHQECTTRADHLQGISRAGTQVQEGVALKILQTPLARSSTQEAGSRYYR
jgi:hypothetical protein